MTNFRFVLEVRRRVPLAIGLRSQFRFIDFIICIIYIYTKFTRFIIIPRYKIEYCLFKKTINCAFRLIVLIPSR